MDILILLIKTLIMNPPIFIATVMLLIIIWILFTYNSFVKKRIKIEQAKSSIDVYLTKRFDLIPNLIECVKGYMNYEQSVLEKVTALRSNYTKTKNLKSGAELNEMCNNMIIVAENNPNLKASEHFLNLQKSLTKIENQLQAARRIYNSEVTNYNIKIVTIPSNIVANLFGFRQEELFAAESGAEKNINVEL